MHPALEQPDIEPNIIQQWTEASTLLATAISRFCDLSTLLETQCTFRNEGSSDMIDRLDLSLNYLQSSVDRRLTQARVSLAKTRNRLTRNVFTIPQEVLCEIFQHAIYSPNRGNEPSTNVMDMSYRVGIIYRRLYSLLSVCKAWWQVGITCRNLWSVTPIFPPEIGCLPSQPDLSLQRGPSKGLNLAASLTRGSLHRLSDLGPHRSRFSTINISYNPDSGRALSELLGIFLRGNTLPSISRLSLYDTLEEDLDKHLIGFRPQFQQLLGSLSTLRLSGFTLDWRRVTFSNRLVALQLSRISLGEQSRIEIFISALATANTLRDLKLISIRGVPDEAWHTIIPSSETPILPHLECLYIGDVCINIFNLFIKAIASGSYRLTLNITPAFITRYYLSNNSTSSPKFANVDCDEFCASLHLAKINKLVIGMDKRMWSTPTGFRALLKSLPELKTIVLNYCSIESDILKAFRQPPRPSGCKVSFPRLEVIEFHRSAFGSPLGQLKKEFKDVLASHPVQRMILGMHFEEVQEDDPMIRWLKTTVPEFRLFPMEDVASELCSTWELWDV
ncbi:unnamed protein product [Rhizoctonia solani]|uniref:Uncharacterized protein n=1 Tax=Rhizoctonia solani TaxID=456999 RepID=A0A8H2WJY2_9AGAM|nr:unnamed protein product [Rhizoctonia solani]